MGLRILIFHGYLLRGTGSNIYNAELARTLVRLGHEVHLLCQESHAAEFDFVDAVGHWSNGRLDVGVVRQPVRCTAYLPDIGQLLPLYVADRYAGFDARPFPELTDGEIERYLAANVAAVRDVAAAAGPDAALANHIVMGPVILARALAGAIPYAVKIHGSALEYTVRPHLERFGRYAREGLAGASVVLAARAIPPRACGRWQGCRTCRPAPGSCRPVSMCASSARARRPRRRPGWARWPTAWRRARPAGAARPTALRRSGRPTRPATGWSATSASSSSRRGWTC